MKNLKKLFMIAFALVLFMPLCVLAAEGDPFCIGDTCYETIELALAAAQNDDEIVVHGAPEIVGTRVNITKDVKITGADENAKIVLKYNEGKTANAAFEVKAKVEVDNITIESERYCFYVRNNGELKVGADAVLNAQEYGIAIFPIADSAKVDVYGTVKGLAQDGDTGYPAIGSYGSNTGNTTINIYEGAVVESLYGPGIYMPGRGALTVNGGTIKGKESAIGIKAGNLTIKGGNLIVTGEDTTPTAAYNNGINASGAVIQIESNSGYYGHINIEITGGHFKGNGHVFYEYLATAEDNTAVQGISIEGGIFEFASGKSLFNVSNKLQLSKMIYGGIYTQSIASGLIADTFTLAAGNGGYAVVTAKTVEVEKLDTTNPVSTVTGGIGSEDDAADFKTNIYLTISQDAELIQAIAGKDFEAKLTSEVITPIQTVQDAFADKLSDKGEDVQIVNYLDITIGLHNDDDGLLANVTELASDATVTILLPEAVATVPSGKVRTYYVVREHNGEYDYLPCTLSQDGKSITFDSDKFSVYALAYVDAVNPNTLDTSSILTIAIAVSSVAFASLYIVSKKRFN